MSLLSKLIQVSGMQLLLPFYHVVSDEPLPHIQHLYRIKSVAEFERDLDVLLRHFTPISLPDVVESIRSNKTFAEPVMHLSVDDGFRQCADEIAPILLRKGIPATFFINSGFVDNQDLMYRNKLSLLVEQNVISKEQMASYTYQDVAQIDQLALQNGFSFTDYLARQSVYLTSDQIRLLVEQGFSIGGHSHTHPMYSQLSVDDQLSQTEKSVSLVNDLLHQPFTAFAFPFHDLGVTKEFFMRSEHLVDCYFSTGGLKVDEHKKVLRRVNFEEQTNPERSLHTIYAKYLLKKSLGFRHTHYR